VIAELMSGSDIAAAKALIESHGLTFETGFDNLVGSYEQGELVGVGARAGNIMKMLAVETEYQGGSLLGEIVTLLVSRGYEAGFDSLFVYTKPEYAGSFQALNFKLLATQAKVALLEYGNGLKNWLAAHSTLVKSGVNGAVVMNCNPFTLGHRYLVETAARQVDHLYLFVVREDRSVFPFAVRMRLVKEGVRDLENVIVLDTGNYLISSATFPTYFLKKDDPVARIQMELDVTLFASRIAPYFGISRRFVGSEPLCQLTNAYNDTMREILPPRGIALVEIERREALATAISASHVRELLAQGDLTQLQNHVPASTLDFLQSEEAASIRRRLEGTAA
jgi:[citrate (pro-3S)-lyase] ligase